MCFSQIVVRKDFNDIMYNVTLNILVRIIIMAMSIISYVPTLKKYQGISMGKI